MAGRFVLSGLARLFSAVTEFRAGLYQRGYLRQHRLQHPTISVGNLSVGGTGKTPIVACLAEQLIDLGYRPFILSRGYRGSAESSVEVVSDGSRILSTPDRCGDEPFLLAKTVPAARIVVGSKRWKAARALGEPGSKTIYLMDDGFQHLQLFRDLNILVVDATRSPWTDAPLPKGRLREPLVAMQRADIVILSRTHHLGVDRMGEMIQKLNKSLPQTPVFPFSHQIKDLFDLQNARPVPIDLLREKRWVVLAAIGNPKQFLLDVQQADGTIVGQALYRDHHRFSVRDLADLASTCQETAADAVLTTEKDAVRLSLPDDFPCPVYTLRIQAVDRSQTQFKSWLCDWLCRLDPKTDSSSTGKTPK